MKLRIDPDTCTGHLRCYELYPEFFDVDALGHGLVISPDVDPADLDRARSAAKSCPERAIAVES